MGLRFMEHLLILTPDPDGPRDCWRDVLGMREGDHPDFGFPVHWLYIGDQARSAPAQLDAGTPNGDDR